MTYSPLTNERMPPTGTYNGSPKWSPRPAGARINGLNVHHHAATSDAGITRLVSSSDPASANYIIRNNGSLIGSVPEEYRAWTTSAYANDDDKVTVEIQNETDAPSWRISDKAMNTLIRLYADLAQRHGFAPVRANLKGHQEYGIATACPGPYLLPRLDDVARKAAALGTTTQEDDMTLTTAQADQLDDLHRLLLRKFTEADQQVDIVDGVRRGDIVIRRIEADVEQLVVANRSLSAGVEALAAAQGLDPVQTMAVLKAAAEDALSRLTLTVTPEV